MQFLDKCKLCAKIAESGGGLQSKKAGSAVECGSWMGDRGVVGCHGLFEAC